MLSIVCVLFLLSVIIAIYIGHLLQRSFCPKALTAYISSFRVSSHCFLPLSYPTTMYGRDAKRAALWCAITRRDLLDNTSGWEEFPSGSRNRVHVIPTAEPVPVWEFKAHGHPAVGKSNWGLGHRGQNDAGELVIASVSGNMNLHQYHPRHVRDIGVTLSQCRRLSFSYLTVVTPFRRLGT